MNILRPSGSRYYVEQLRMLRSENAQLKQQVTTLEKHLAYEKENAALLVAAVADIQNELKVAQRATELLGEESR